MRKKLNSERGVAMVFAIVAFVVVMVMGAVIYTAGYANYSKLFGRKNERQTYYTLVSAAKYAGSQLDGATIRITKAADFNESKGAYEAAGDVPDSVEFDGDEWGKAVIKQAYSSTSDSTSGTAEYAIEFSNDTDFSEKIKVKISDFHIENESFTMELSDESETNFLTVEFSISPAFGEAYLLVTKEDGTEVQRRIQDTTYTIRMGDILTESEADDT